MTRLERIELELSALDDRIEDFRHAYMMGSWDEDTANLLAIKQSINISLSRSLKLIHEELSDQMGRVLSDG